MDWMQLFLQLVQCLHLVLLFLESMPGMIHLLHLHTNRTGNDNQCNPNHVHNGRLPYTQCRDHPCHRCCIYKNADNGVHNLFVCRCTIGQNTLKPKTQLTMLLILIICLKYNVWKYRLSSISTVLLYGVFDLPRFIIQCYFPPL